MSADLHPVTPAWGVQAPHVRCILKRALALQSTQNIWSGTEHINNAIAMIYGDEISDSGPWMLNRSQLLTLVIAIKWRRAKHDSPDRKTAPDIAEHREEIEDAVIATYREASHAQGIYWV